MFAVITMSFISNFAFADFRDVSNAEQAVIIKTTVKLAIYKAKNLVCKQNGNVGNVQKTDLMNIVSSATALAIDEDDSSNANTLKLNSSYSGQDLTALVKRQGDSVNEIDVTLVNASNLTITCTLN